MGNNDNEAISEELDKSTQRSKDNDIKIKIENEYSYVSRIYRREFLEGSKQYLILSSQYKNIILGRVGGETIQEAKNKVKEVLRDEGAFGDYTITGNLILIEVGEEGDVIEIGYNF